MQKIDAIIRVAFNINPKELSDDDWCQYFQDWVYVERIKLNAQEAMFKHTMKSVAIEVLNEYSEAQKKGRKAKPKR